MSNVLSMFGTIPREHPVYMKLSCRHLRRISSSKMWHRFVWQLVLKVTEELAAYLSECKTLSHYICSSVLSHIWSTHTHTQQLCKNRYDLPVLNFKFHTKPIPTFSLNECCSTLRWPNKRHSNLKPDGSPKQKSKEELRYNTFYPGCDRLLIRSRYKCWFFEQIPHKFFSTRNFWERSVACNDADFMKNKRCYDGK